MYLNVLTASSVSTVKALIVSNRNMIIELEIAFHKQKLIVNKITAEREENF